MNDGIMAVVIDCPVKRTPVRIGSGSDLMSFRTCNFSGTINCTACGGSHSFTMDDAYLEGMDKATVQSLRKRS